jgi:hypothetical protein
MSAVQFSSAFFRLASLSIILIPALAGQTTAQNHLGAVQRQVYEAAREEWLSRGRTPPAGHTAAELRLRAHQEKLRLRAVRA